MPIKAITGVTSQVKGDVGELAKVGYDTALKVLEGVIEALEKELGGGAVDVIERYFKIDKGALNSGTCLKILQIYQATYVGLKEYEFTLNIEFFSSAKRGVKDKINIALAQFKNPVQLVRYLIHEATHAYANTVDFGERGYVGNDGGYRDVGLAHEDAMNNADTYAVVAVLLFDMPLV